MLNQKWFHDSLVTDEHVDVAHSFQRWSSPVKIRASSQTKSVTKKKTPSLIKTHDKESTSTCVHCGKCLTKKRLVNEEIMSILTQLLGSEPVISKDDRLCDPCTRGLKRLGKSMMAEKELWNARHPLPQARRPIPIRPQTPKYSCLSDVNLFFCNLDCC